MTELDYDVLDPGIRKTVRFLRDNGFNTTDSGDGKTKQAKGYIGEPEPNVYMTCNPAAPTARLPWLDYGAHLILEADRLLELLVAKFGPKIREKVQIEASYSPIDKIGILALHGLSDKDLDGT